MTRSKTWLIVTALLTAFPLGAMAEDLVQSQATALAMSVDAYNGV
jgi:hypothetical protein